MRSSDWSSDVCSSDLGRATGRTAVAPHNPQARIDRGRQHLLQALPAHCARSRRGGKCGRRAAGWTARLVARYRNARGGQLLDRALARRIPRAPSGSSRGTSVRSEEHTSELQSLMRISYAVFFLKKTKKK